MVSVLLGVSSCAVFDTRQTVQVYAYPPPSISKITINETQIGITITSDMYYPNHEDFSYYVVLSGRSDTDFQTELDQGNLSSMASVNLIPNYLTNTGKPTAAGNYLNPITINIPRANFISETNYAFAVIAYGYNSSYGRLYDNNGWLYSDVSIGYVIHNPQFTNFLVTNGQGLLFRGGGWQVSDAAADAVDFVFVTNETTDLLPTRIQAKGNLGISPLGLLETDTIVTLPKDGYITTQSYPRNYFAIIPTHTYALKNISANTYAKLYIENFDSKNRKVNFKLIYTTIPDVRVF